MALLTLIYYKIYPSKRSRKGKAKSSKGKLTKYAIVESCILVSMLYIMFQGDNYQTHRRRRNNVKDLLLQSNRNGMNLADSQPVEHDCPTRIPKFNSNFTIPADAKFLLPVLKWGPNNQIAGFYSRV